MKVHRVLSTVGAVAAMLLAACDGAPSEAEFIAACMKEGDTPTQRARDRQMGVNRDAFCKCATQEAKATYSPSSQRAALLGMAGKKEEARAITAKMNDSEQEIHMKGGLAIMRKCLRGAP